MITAERQGFTLPEVVVAVLLTALLVAATHRVAVQVGEAGSHAIRTAMVADREANAERLLRALVGSYEADPADATPFVGEPVSMRFHAWCDTPTGWQERCEVVLRLDGGDDATTLRAEMTIGGRRRVEVLGAVPPGAAFRYLENAADGGRWSRGWTAQPVAPVAVSVPLAGEDLLVRLGVRG